MKQEENIPAQNKWNYVQSGAYYIPRKKGTVKQTV